MSHKRTALQKCAVAIVALLAVIGMSVMSSAFAATVIYMPGFNYPEGDESMAGVLQGKFDQPEHVQVHLNDKQTHPAALGLLSGLRGMSGDDSVATSVATLTAQVLAVKATDPDGKIYLVGYSHGGLGVSTALSQMMEDGVDLSGVEVYTLGAPLRPSGGILTRFPEGFYIPIVQLTAGPETPADGPNVTMVTIQYDGIGDAPTYPLNVLASASAIIGYFAYHGLYGEVDLESPDNIVRTSGNLVDVLVPMKPAILVPLERIGVPSDIVEALVPLTKALVETGYDRTGDPAVRQTFRLLPPVSQWGTDARSVLEGAKETSRLLKEAIKSRKEAVRSKIQEIQPEQQTPQVDNGSDGLENRARASARELTSQLQKPAVELGEQKRREWRSPDTKKPSEMRRAVSDQDKQEADSVHGTKRPSVSGWRQSLRDTLGSSRAERSEARESEKRPLHRRERVRGVEAPRKLSPGTASKGAVSSDGGDKERRKLKDAS